MPSVELKGVSRHVCKEVDLRVNDGEFLVLLGPNGSGKTTLLTVIAGLAGHQGSVFFDGVCMDKVPASKRRVSYLPQDLVLFPHMTVRKNIGYGLKMRGDEDAAIQDRVQELVQLMHLDDLMARYPSQLSGGEKQRVAIARAIAPSPRVLLLDEPLSSLDLQTAKRLRTEIRRLHDLTGITSVYVTHNLEEAEELGDRVAVLHSGSVQQVGPPATVFCSPLNEYVADFIGSPNILDCDYCRPLGHGVVEVGCKELAIVVPHEGDSVKRIAFLPSDVYLSAGPLPGPRVNGFEGEVIDLQERRDLVRVSLLCGGNVLLAEVPKALSGEIELEKGGRVSVMLKLRRIRTYEDYRIG